MSDLKADPGIEPSSMREELLFGFLFGGVAITFLFITFRLFVRWKLFKKLLWDDAFVILSWMLLVGVAAASWNKRDGLYIMWYLLKGLKPWTEENIRLVIDQLRMLVAIAIMFLTALWSIKISFLIFFRRLGTVKRSQRIWWWMVTVFTVITFLAILGSTPFWCTSSDFNVLVAKCNTPWSLRYKRIFYFCYFGSDIATDALIMSIPVIMLWKVKMPLKQKLGLMALFSLTVVVIVCAIVSITINSSGKGADQDATWIIFWASLEVTISIIVACCGAFRQLFKRFDSQNTKTVGPSSPRSKTKTFISFGTRHRSDQEDRDAEQGLIRGPKQIIISREVEVEEIDILLTQVDRAHLSPHRVMSTTRREDEGFETGAYFSQSRSVKPGFL